MLSNNVFQYSKIRTRKRSAKKSIKTGRKKWNPALFGTRNPLCWNLESSTRNPESTAWNPESKTVLDFLTWGDFISCSIGFSSKLACLASVSARVGRENWDKSKKKKNEGEGEWSEGTSSLFPLPLPFFLLPLQLSRYYSTGNAWATSKLPWTRSRSHSMSGN